MTPEVERKLAAITDLPTLPAVIGKLNAAVADPGMDAERIALLLQDDPAVSAKVLKVVNSALYAGAERISSVQLAVARLGMSGVRNVAMSAAVVSAFGDGREDAFDRQEFWRHCILSGIAATVLNQRVRDRLERHYPDDVLHLAGLVHDVGRIVFDQYFHEAFHQSLELASSQYIPLGQAEVQVIGADHAEVGAWLSQRWNVSEELVQSIRWHHEPGSADDPYRELVSLCNAGNYLCNYQQLGWSGDPAPMYLPSVWSSVGLSAGDAHELGEQIKAESMKSEVLAAFQ